MSAVNESQAIRSKMHDFLDRLLSALRWVLTREAVPDPREWLEMDPRARFGLMPRDFPACMRFLRGLEADRDALICLALARSTPGWAEAREEPETPTVIPVLEAFQKLFNAQLITSWENPGIENPRPKSEKESDRASQLLSALLYTTLDALYEGMCPILFDAQEISEMWLWETELGNSCTDCYFQ